jgi:hypothetical protein
MSQPAAIPGPVAEASWWARHARGLATLALGVAVVLCLGGGTGAFFLIGATQPRGQVDPTAAVDGFLRAVFTDHSPDEAVNFVCAASRQPGQLKQLVDRVQAFEDAAGGGQTTWVEPAVTVQRRHATAKVELQFTRDGEPIASRAIELDVVDQRGWWVCGVKSAG